MTIIDSILQNREENINFNLWNRGASNISKSRFKQIVQEQDSILIVRREKKQEKYDLKRNELNAFIRASLKQK